MFEQAFGRLVSGALWGLGAGLVLAVMRNGGTGVKPLARGAMKAYLSASEKVQELSSEARESLEDLYAEVKTEQEEDEEKEAGTKAEASKATERRS